MKKIIIILSVLSITFFSYSCKKNNSDKDVQSCIDKMNQFNQKFSVLYQDSIISREKINEDEKPEFEVLSSIASEYYELVNSINEKIKKDKEKRNKGKSSDNYEDSYLKSIDAKKAELEKVTTLFMENMKKIDPTLPADTVN